MRAAVLHEFGAPLRVRDDVTLEPPRAGEVRVRIAASGICGSDLKAADGHSPVVPHLPVILGHESAGVVEEIGDGVTLVAPGDHVVIAMVGTCGRCPGCRRGGGCVSDLRLSQLGLMRDGTTRLRVGGEPARGFLSIGAFAEHTVVNEEMLVRIDPGVPLTAACLLACGVVTGVGAVLNTARVEPGATVVVVGVGGVGLNVVQGAALAGASRIVAADINPAKLALATELGATDTLVPGDDLAKQVAELFGGAGADYAFDASGRPDVLPRAFAATRPGGTTVMVGSPPDRPLEIPPRLLFADRVLKGCQGGGGNPARELPRLLDLWRAGRIDLDRLVSTVVGLDDVNEAFDAVRAGSVARAVVALDR